MEQFGGAVGQGEEEVGGTRPSLARLLDEAGFASRDQVEDALAEGTQTGERLGEVLLRRAVVDEAQLARLLARQWNLRFLDEQSLEPNLDALSLLPSDDARRIGGVPVGWQDGRLQVAVAEPSEERLRALRERLGSVTQYAVVTARTLQQLLEQTNAAPGDTGVETTADGSAPTGDSLAALAELVGELDHGTARVLAVRGKIEQLAAGLLEREQALGRYEAELADAQGTHEHDKKTISRLESELADARRSHEDTERANDELRRQLDKRNQLLRSLKTQLIEFTNTFGHVELE